MSKRDLGKVLITGADGFIGSHLAEMVADMGYETTALCVYNSNGSFGWLDQIKERKNLNCLLGDVRDPFQMAELTKGHSTVFHLASLIAIPYSYVAPQSYVETNISGTLNMLQAALSAGVQRFVHTSTSEVYGTARVVPISESHPFQPQSPYSASKIGADMMAESFFNSFGLPVVTLRPFNTYGPRQSQRAVIPSVAAQVLSGVKKLRLGSLSPIRDFNYVTDTVAAFISVAEGSCVELGRAYNAGSGRSVTIGETVQMICKAAGRLEVEILEDPDRIRPQNSEVFELQCDSSLLQKVTSWKPEVDLESGLENVVRWLRDSPQLSKAGLYQR